MKPQHHTTKLPKRQLKPVDPSTSNPPLQDLESAIRGAQCSIHTLPVEKSAIDSSCVVGFVVISLPFEGGSNTTVRGSD